MTSFSRRLRLLAPGAALVVLGLASGCSVLSLARSHTVSVDAISAQPGPGGLSYQLVAKDPRISRDTSLHGRALACVQAALADKGMFEAPPKVQADLLISVDYGIGNSIPSINGQPAVEKYLYLSGRKNVPGSPTKMEELWNVRVTIAEPNTSLVGCLPLLAAVAADYVGQDSGSEKPVSIPDNSPAVARIKGVMTAAGTAPAP